MYSIYDFMYFLSHIRREIALGYGVYVRGVDIVNKLNLRVLTVGNRNEDGVIPDGF